MPIVTLGSSKSFVSDAKLQIPKYPANQGLMAATVAATNASAAGANLNTPDSQALIAGSGLFLAEDGVSSQTKQDIVSCTLFAQFHASAMVPDSSKTADWYAAYFHALNRIGFATTSRDFHEQAIKGNTLRVHKEILSTLAILLGPAATALAVAKAVLSGLENMGSDSGWLTLFDSRTVFGKVSRFQVVSAHSLGNCGISIALAGFELRSKRKMTKILFFESKKTSVKLRYAAGMVTIFEPVLAGVRDQLQQRLADAAAAFVNSVPIPKVP